MTFGTRRYPSRKLAATYNIAEFQMPCLMAIATYPFSVPYLIRRILDDGFRDMMLRNIRLPDKGPKPVGE